MSGFELPDDTATLDFDGTRFEGLKVEVRVDVSLKDFIKLDDMQEQEGAMAVLKHFGQHILQSWNATKKGKALPATGDGMLEISPTLGFMIIQQWRDAITSVPGPLAPQSSNGNLEADLNLGSSSRPGS